MGKEKKWFMKDNFSFSKELRKIISISSRNIDCNSRLKKIIEEMMFMHG